MMTPQENQALREFLAQLTQVQGIQKDAQAASMIIAAFAQQPDAGYLLVQRSMLQDQAVANASNQIAQLQAQLRAERESARGGSGGAGGGFLDPANAWGNSAADLGRGNNDSGARAPQPQRYEGATAPQYMPAQAQQYAPAQRPGLFGGGGGGLFGGGGGGGSFLGTMAATAAGVAGGAFLFQGIGNMMGGHHGGASGLMGQNNPALPAENTTVNNFYGADTESTGAGKRTQLADNSIDDGGNANDFSGNDDLGSSDDMSSI